MKNNRASAISRLANCGAGNWNIDSLSLAPSNAVRSRDFARALLFFKSTDSFQSKNQYIIL